MVYEMGLCPSEGLTKTNVAVTLGQPQSLIQMGSNLEKPIPWATLISRAWVFTSASAKNANVSQQRSDQEAAGLVVSLFNETIIQLQD